MKLKLPWVAWAIYPVALSVVLWYEYFHYALRGAELHGLLFLLLLPSSPAVLDLSEAIAARFGVVLGSGVHVLTVCAACLMINSSALAGIVWAFLKASRDESVASRRR